MVALKLKTFGRTVILGIAPNKLIACCHEALFSQALIAELQLTTSGGIFSFVMTSSRFTAPLPLPTFLTGTNERIEGNHIHPSG